MSQYSISVPPKNQKEVSEGLHVVEKAMGLNKSELFREAAMGDLFNLQQLSEFVTKQSLKTKDYYYLVVTVEK